METVARSELKASFMNDTLECIVFNRLITEQCKPNLTHLFPVHPFSTS